MMLGLSASMIRTIHFLFTPLSHNGMIAEGGSYEEGCRAPDRGAQVRGIAHVCLKSCSHLNGDQSLSLTLFLAWQ